MIDPHVHLRDWQQAGKETILHGMTVAAASGFTHLFDMPNTAPPCTDRDTIISRLADGGEGSEKTGVSYHLYAGLTADCDQIHEMVEVHDELFPLVVGLKMFAGQSTGNMGIIGYEKQLGVFKALAEAGYSGVLAVHCEKEELMNPSLFIPGRWETHSLSRPAKAEVESVNDIVKAAAEAGYKGTLHICHVSAKGTVELVRELRKSVPFRITMGATPHHALLTAEDAKVHERYLKMNPPLRSEEDREAVFQALVDGTIDWAESDHAPHTIADKENGASGIPGLPGMLLLASRLRDAGCSENRLDEIFGKKVQSVFSLSDSGPSVPQDAGTIYEKMAGEYPWNPFSC
ncbi:MAG: dihydroorotase [Spirochaetes bacterium]|uniref:Dihydroorotase n=1 Tax=Candidatus Ornithospirochaeta stercoripullorum TaxID=2840899 RepID=A0A9D9H3Z2_9SPIO|nr:dihydroorotase [Candidatus Ornithospirochaeta stercoripullorum]